MATVRRKPTQSVRKSGKPVGEGAANSTLLHGLRVLETLAGTAQPFGVSELARLLELPKSRIHRLLQTLVATGYLRRTADGRRYRIGLKPVELSCALLHHLPLRRLALPVVHRLCTETGHETVFTVLHDDASLVVAAVYPQGQQRDPGTSIGNRLLLHCSASGKLLLAHADDREEIMARLKLTPRSEFTITTVPVLRQELARIRRDGLSVNNQENGIGVVSMAAPVRDATGAIAGALGLACRFPEAELYLEQYKTAVRTMAEELSRAAAAAGISGAD